MTSYNRYFADVSSAQPHVNMHDYADAGHLLIGIKATEGYGYVNPYHRGQALAAGLRHVAVAHYHFARPDLGTDPARECDHFLNATERYLGPYDYVVLDFERGIPAGWQRDSAWTRAWDTHLRDHSRFRTILYGSRSWLQQRDDWLEADPKRVWDAAYGTEPDYAPPGYECVFRQYTDGVVGPEPRAFAGIGHCDGNRMSNDIYRHLLEYRR